MVVEELGRAVAPGPLLATVTQFAPMVREVGTPEQQQRFLSDVASGAVAGTVALADHPRAWSLDDVTMTAEQADGGWVLDGTKVAVLAGEGITDVIVVARAGEGLGAFVVPAAEAGLVPVHSLDASRPLANAALDHVLVGDDHALGEPGSAASTLGISRAVQEATVGLALETVGAVDALFQLVLAYIKDRKQFGVAIGSFQAMKHKMSNMFLSLERARVAVLLRGGRHQRGHADTGDRRGHGQGRQRRLSEPGLPRIDPVLRRHRVHVGARRSLLRQAGHQRRCPLRRRGRTFVGRLRLVSEVTSA